MTTSASDRVLHDLRDIRAWLESLHPGTGAKLLVHWHRGGSDRELSYIIVYGPGNPAVHKAI